MKKYQTSVISLRKNELSYLKKKKSHQKRKIQPGTGHMPVDPVDTGC